LHLNDDNKAKDMPEDYSYIIFNQMKDNAYFLDFKGNSNLNWNYIPYNMKALDSIKNIIENYLRLNNKNENSGGIRGKILRNKFYSSRSSSGFFKYSVDFSLKVIQKDGSFLFKDSSSFFNSY